MKKKVFIKTYGCQMNEYDSQFIKNITKKMEFESANSYKEADLIIINTCNIREKATEKLYSELGRINEFKQRKIVTEDKYTVIAVIGCVAQSDGETILKRAPYVDIIIGPQGYHKFEELYLNAVNKTGSKIMLDFVANEKFDFLAEEILNRKQDDHNPSAFITIQEGCDRFCTFCVVPYTRGPEVSRKVNDILNEIKALRDKGTKEVVLLGQNVNAYHGTDLKGAVWNLAQLISEIALIDGIERIRYTTSHPCYIDEELIAVHGYEEKLMPMLNLPVQSGSTKILKSMNRRHTQEEYMNIVKLLQKVRSNLIMSSDFIVGFPGETDEDFEETLNLVNKVVFSAQSFAFKYSPRIGTPASTIEQVPEEVKADRLKRLQNALETQRATFHQNMLDKEVKILFDNKTMRYANQIGGRTEFGQIAVVNNITSSNIQLQGTIQSAKVIKVHSNTLECELL